MADVKPADVYVGVVELFSVLLPGAFLTAGLVVAAPVDPSAFSPLFDEPEAQWVAFALVSYALGALVFSFAADMDQVYDRFRKKRWPDKPNDAYDRATVRRCEFFETEREKRDARDDLAWWLTKLFRQVIFLLVWGWFIGKAPDADGEAPQADASGGHVAAGEVDAADKVDVDTPMNTFSWAKTLLSLRAPGALAEVQRYEAESKFFRSLVLVLPVVGGLGVAHWWWAQRPLAITAIVLPLALAPLCFRRYAERRHKSTEWAYFYAIGYVEGLKKLGPPPADAPNPAQGGGGHG